MRAPVAMGKAYPRGLSRVDDVDRAAHGGRIIAGQKRDGLGGIGGVSMPPEHTALTSSTRTAFHNADCGLAPGSQIVPFTLAFQKPRPIPVETSPLDCEPWGLCLCT